MAVRIANPDRDWRGRHAGILPQQAAVVKQADRGISMWSAATLPALPIDVLCSIACAALTATGSIKEARIRLSFVCRAWRDSLRGTSTMFRLSLSALDMDFPFRCSDGFVAYHIAYARRARSYATSRTPWLPHTSIASN